MPTSARGRCWLAGVDVSQLVVRDAGRGQLVGDDLGGVVEEDCDVMVVAELAGGGEGAEVDRIQAPDAEQVEDQSRRAQATHGVDEGAAQLGGAAAVAWADRIAGQVGASHTVHSIESSRAVTVVP